MSMASARPLTSSSTAAGYRALLAWMRGFGRLRAVGVEGAGSYGAALARHLAAKGGEGDRGRPS
jgi:transposase